jgi:hypothetical protein
MVKFDVLEMLKWFVSISLGMSSDVLSKVETGTSSRSKYASIDMFINGATVSFKASVALDDGWWILSMVAEDLEGSCATLSISFDGNVVTISSEDSSGVYTTAICSSVADVQWEYVSSMAAKVISSL